MPATKLMMSFCNMLLSPKASLNVLLAGLVFFFGMVI